MSFNFFIDVRGIDQSRYSSKGLSSSKPKNSGARRDKLFKKLQIEVPTKGIEDWDMDYAPKCLKEKIINVEDHTLGEYIRTQDCRCLCGQKIYRLFTIRNKKTGSVGVIGSTCIHHFSDETISNFKIMKKNFNKSRKEIEKFGETRLDFGKHKGKAINEIYQKDRSYLKWIINNDDWTYINFKKSLKSFLKYKNTHPTARFSTPSNTI